MIPFLVSAQGGFIPCDGGLSDECGYDDLLILINNVIDWIIKISVPIAAGVFAWAGIKMMIHGDNPGKRSESINTMKKVFIGFVFILSAWIIVTTITNALLSDKNGFKDAVPVQGVK